jgi:hypothetical protein
MFEIEKDRVEDLFELSSTVSVATTKQNVSSYDFDFRRYFQVRTIIGEKESNLILRIGAINDYEKVYDFFLESGLKLINSKEEHQLVSLLPNWYERIKDLTPKSFVFDTLPNADLIEQHFLYPIFIKGERQTNKHKKELCIAENKSDLERIVTDWNNDPILHWQKLIVREFVRLQPIETNQPNQLQKSLEVRVFVYFGNILSIGQYWESENKIQLNTTDENIIQELSEVIYSRIPVPFMVIDFGKTIENDWIVIELNDAQESGYALNSKIKLWNNLLETEIP